MAAPSVHQMRRNTGLESIHSETVPQSFRHCLRSGDMSCGHYPFDAPPSGGAAPLPKSLVAFRRIALRAANVELGIELEKQAPRQGNLPDKTGLPPRGGGAEGGAAGGGQREG